MLNPFDTQALSDAIYGVSPYRGVLVLDRAADYCVTQGYEEAAALLREMACDLDDQLFKELLEAM